MNPYQIRNRSGGNYTQNNGHYWILCRDPAVPSKSSFMTQFLLAHDSSAEGELETLGYQNDDFSGGMS